MSYYRQPPNRVYGTAAIGLPPLTPVVKALLILCCTVWVAQLIAQWAMGGAKMIFVLGIVPGLVVRGYVWQPFTYMFLHSTASPWHLVFNMLVLYMFGGDLERHWGGKRFLRYYLVCGVGAGIFVTLAGLLFGRTAVPTIGASGAIYGLILAFGIVFAERIVLFMMFFPMKARTMSWILFGVTFFFSVDSQSSGVSHIAHLGGGIVGYLYLKRVWNVREFYRELRWKLRRRKFRVMPPRDEDRWIH